MRSKKVMKKLTVLFASVLFCSSVPYALTKSETMLADTQSEQKYEPKISVNLMDGDRIALLSGNVYEVAAHYYKYAVYSYMTGKDCFAPSPAVLSWDCEEEGLYYIVRVGRKRDLSDAKSYFTFNRSLRLNDLYAGEKYYYQIDANYGEYTIRSRIFGFETQALVRTVSIDGVSNTRDMGGYITEDGMHRVRQGMVYRGASLDEVTESGKYAAHYVYGIKTDLDLRGAESAVTVSPLGNDVQYILLNAPYYVDAWRGINAIGTGAHYRETLKREIQTFAKEENYPILMHCSLGRDRTGTLAFLLNALLGVQEDDLYLDYEMSFLSETGCLGGDRQYLQTMEAFTTMYDYIRDYADGTLSQNTETFMLELGVSMEEIKAIRSILLEEISE